MMGPSAVSPETTCGQRNPATGPAIFKDTGYLVVNHPTVRDRSMSAPSSSWRPWASTSMPIGAPVSPRNSAHASPKAINRMSWIPAWNAVGTSPSSIAVVSASSSTDKRPALA